MVEIEEIKIKIVKSKEEEGDFIENIYKIIIKKSNIYE